MISKAGFTRTFQFLSMFRDGLICTVSLSALTVFFGFILALILAIIRLSHIQPFRALGIDRDGHLREQGFLSLLSRFNPLSFLATVYDQPDGDFGSIIIHKNLYGADGLLVVAFAHRPAAQSSQQRHLTPCRVPRRRFRRQ